MKKIALVGILLIAAVSACKRASDGSGQVGQSAATVSEPGLEPKNIETTVADLSALLEKRDYPAAAEIYTRVVTASASPRPDSASSSSGLGPGPDPFLAKALDDIDTLLIAAMKREIDALRAGQPDNINVLLLNRLFRRENGPDLWSLYSEARPELDSLRRASAPRWIRISNFHIHNHTVFDERVAKTVATRIVPPPGFHIAFGPPTGEAERKATFCTVWLDLRPEWNTYHVYVKDRPYIQLVENELKLILGLDLMLTTDLRAGVTSSNLRQTGGAWESASQERRFELGKVPKGSEFELENETVARFAENHNKLLEQRINEGIKLLEVRLPELKFFATHSNPRPLSLEHALSDRSGFHAALRAATPGASAEQEAWELVIVLGMDELQAEFINRLPELKPSVQRNILHALAAQPWFADYKPLLYFLKTGTPGADGSFRLALNAMDETLYETEAWALVKDRIKDTPALALDLAAQASSAPADVLPKLLELSRQIPAEPAGQLLAALALKDPAAAERIFAELERDVDSDRLLHVCKPIGAHFNVKGRQPPSPIYQQFLFASICKMTGQGQVDAIGSAAHINKLWIMLFEKPREDWSPEANLALLRFAPVAAAQDVDRCTKAFRELCQLALAGHSFGKQEMRQIDTAIRAAFESATPSSVLIDIPLVKVLLIQPEGSPLAPTFNAVIPYMLPGISPYFSLGHPEAPAILELALAHHSNGVRRAAMLNIRAGLDRHPAYNEIIAKYEAAKEPGR